MGDDSEYVFPHSFITMVWNLIESSDNCVKMYIYNVQWKDDCLIFVFGMSKTESSWICI